MTTPADHTPIFSIGAVARMLDVPSATIRNWESRYDGVRPVRSSGGQRLYSRQDVEHLSFVRDAIEGGVSPADAHRMLAERVSMGEPLREPDADAPQVLILVAERNDHAAELVDYLLRTEGFAVEVATTPAEALERFASLSPALVIVQLLLGGGAGIDLCHELKRLGAPAVLATSELRTEPEALAAGADAFLERPLNSLALVSTVKDLLARSAMLRSAPPVGV